MTSKSASILGGWRTILLAIGTIAGAIGTLTGWGYDAFASEQVDMQIDSYCLSKVNPRLDTLERKSKETSELINDMRWTLAKIDKMLVAIAGERAAEAAELEVKKIREAVE